MLYEFLKYITTPCPPYLRKLGYLSEIIAMEARYKRHQNKWRPHLERTKESILKSAEKCKQKREALILGSGMLYDIPIEQLSEEFEQVILVDIIHMGSVRRRAKQFSNVYIEACDLTGMSKGLLKGDHEVTPVDFFLEREGVDLVVSSNILSQLPIKPKKFLEKKLRQDFDSEGFARNIMQVHLDYLKSFNAEICLISDQRRLFNDKKGNFVSGEDLFDGDVLPASKERWVWDIAPAPEITRKYDVSHEVVYCHF